MAKNSKIFPNRFWVLPSALILGVWIVLVAMMSLLLSMMTSIQLGKAFSSALYLWVVWIFCAPLIIWLAHRVTLDNQQFFRGAMIHILACFLVVMANQAVFRACEFPEALLEEMRKVSFFERIHKRPPMARAPIDVLFYVVILSICHAVDSTRKARERERQILEAEANLSRARLQSLQMQLNPHFLFNSLNAIAAVVHRDPEASENMITDLSELLRVSLASAEKQEVRLRDELEFLDCYLRMEQARFGERLHIEKKIEAAALDANIPTLILQPLVENAIKHGIEPQRRHGTVKVIAECNSDRLTLTIEDTGFGIGDDFDLNQESGVGVANTRARLRQLYPNDHSFSIYQGEEGGCIASIEIPLHSEAPSR